jgi:ABC-2 type transport system permease protein
MHAQNITALFYKQIKDSLKNTPVLVLFIVFPIIALVMTQAMKGQAGMDSLFVSMFSTMHCVFTPIMATSSIIAEEKEKNTLRVLFLSNVTLKEYLLSIGGFVLLANLITGSIFLLFTEYSVKQSLIFMASLAIGSLISLVLGACLGLYSKNAAAASGMAISIGMIFAFMPMLANFNSGIEAISKFTFSGQISYFLAGKDVTVFGLIVLVINFVLLFAIATVLYSKSIKED